MKIAIIGSGASGLTAAYTLQKLGYENITVFEKENRPGGKVFSYEYEGRHYELGAILMDEKYKTILDMVNELNTPIFTIPDLGVVYNNNFYTYEEYIPKYYNTFKVLLSIFNFWRVNKKFSKINETGFSDLHQDLKMPFNVFAKKYNIDIISEIVASFLSGCGYGYYGEIPAMYFLKILPHLIFLPFRYKLNIQKIKPSAFTNGWQSMWQLIADKLDVRYNSSIKKIDRYKTDEKNVVEITTGEKTETFDRLIISAPLETAHNYMDLSDDESCLFNKIKTYDYAVTLFKGSNLPHATVVNNITPDTIGNVVLINHTLQDYDVYTGYQLLPENITEEKSIAKIKETVNNYGGTFDKIIYRKKWSYFPHVSQQDLEEGFYEKLEDLQGVKGSYYVGAIMNFETVDKTAEYAKKLVEREFGKFGK